MEAERRHLPFDKLEVREEGKSSTIVGHIPIFTTRSSDLGGFVETFDPQAFAGSIKDADVRATFNHDPNFVIGRSGAGTLKVWTDDDGLAWEATLPEAEWAKGLRESIKRGDISESSFAFQTLEDKWSREKGDEGDVDGHLRTVVRAELIDVAPVTYAAYPQASAAARSLEQWKETNPPEGGDPINIAALYRQEAAEKED